jgi:hypothetical protein
MKEELKAKKPAPVDGMQSGDADVIKGIKAQSDDIEMTVCSKIDIAECSRQVILGCDFLSTGRCFWSAVHWDE